LRQDFKAQLAKKFSPMPNIIRRPGWFIPERSITPESVYRNRRRFLKELGFSTLGLAGLLSGCSKSESTAETVEAAEAVVNTNAPGGANFLGRIGGAYPFPRNPEFDAKIRITPEEYPLSYNNFYEFSTSKGRVARLTGKFVTSPWSLEIGGLVEKPMKLSVDEIVAMMPIEERVYRFRCVEAWAMVVPWTGFPFSKLLEKVQPKSSAKFVKFTTFHRPDQAPGFGDEPSFPWPYTEGLRLDEAMNPLVLGVTGLYGKPLPKQNGAPIRIIVPWKYGYKSIKSIVKMELVEKQPATLWETLAPDEYPFESNVNPDVRHPRWSQATERMIDTGNRVNTQIYNGYGSYVAHLYKRP
jgi:sulfoxide reductase catalytic subunit YedY